MVERRKPGREPPEPPADAVPGALRKRVIEQTPAVFITLVSVLIGLVLSDLVTEARSRMHLWPLDGLAVRTWGQLLSNGISALAVWVVLAHLSVARRRTPHITETVSGLGPPLILLAATSFIGRPEIWPWLYGAGVYLAVSILADTAQVRLTMDQPGGARFARLAHPLGHLVICYIGSPAYLVAGYLGQHGRLPASIELAFVFAPLPTAAALVWMFFRDWRAAVDEV
jgi:hypothetical protein